MNVKDVDCPTCGSPSGNWCRRVLPASAANRTWFRWDQPVEGYHVSRERAAAGAEADKDWRDQRREQINEGGVD